MFKKLTHALHHLFNPHCPVCESLRTRENEARREHELELRVCQSCETLKMQLEAQNQIIRELIAKPVVEEQSEPENFKPIMPRHKPWSVRRAELELADRLKAAELRATRTEEVTIENLEQELQ